MSLSRLGALIGQKQRAENSLHRSLPYRRLNLGARVGLQHCLVFHNRSQRIAMKDNGKLNNALMYTDPSGHRMRDDTSGGCGLPSCAVKPSETKSPKPDTLTSPPSPVPTPQSTTLPSTRSTIGSMNEYRLVGYKLRIRWEKVDWLDVGLSAFGIVGDIALASTVVGNPIGPEIWGASEFGEMVGVVSNIKSAYDLVTESDTTGIVLEGLKASAKVARIDTPLAGSFFDGISIVIDIGTVVEFEPIYQRKPDPLPCNPFPIPNMP